MIGVIRGGSLVLGAVIGADHPYVILGSACAGSGVRLVAQFPGLSCRLRGTPRCIVVERDLAETAWW